MMKTAFAAGAAIFLAATTAMAQTSGTTTQSKTTTTTTTTKWQSPDGTRGGSSSTTQTNTRSKSVTIGTSAPPRPHNSGWHNPQRPAGGSPFAGGWSMVVGKGRPCVLTLYAGFSPEGGGATTTGCASADLQAIGNWVMQGGHTLTLTKSMVSTVATLTRSGPGRFQGMTKTGEPITVWR